MKKWILGFGLAGAGALFATASWSDVATTSASAPTAVGTGSSSAPSVGDIPYTALSPAEQAVVDRGRDTTAWAEVGDTYASAAAEQAQRATAQAAAQQLGVPGLGQTGVVP